MSDRRFIQKCSICGDYFNTTAVIMAQHVNQCLAKTIPKFYTVTDSGGEELRMPVSARLGDLCNIYTDQGSGTYVFTRDGWVPLPSVTTCRWCGSTIQEAHPPMEMSTITKEGKDDSREKYPCHNGQVCTATYTYDDWHCCGCVHQGKQKGDL